MHVTTLGHPRAQDGKTALMVSAQDGHMEVARLLLDSKADIHAADKVPRSGPLWTGSSACAAAASRPTVEDHPHRWFEWLASQLV